MCYPLVFYLLLYYFIIATLTFDLVRQTQSYHIDKYIIDQRSAPNDSYSIGLYVMAWITHVELFH